MKKPGFFTRDSTEAESARDTYQAHAIRSNSRAVASSAKPLPPAN
jgi:hypothetical protein